jgi:hypothetical protein
VDRQQTQGRGRHLADRLVAAHLELDTGTSGSQACRHRTPTVGLAAGGETDQLARRVRAPDRRRRGADPADGERGHDGQAAQRERRLDRDRTAVGPPHPRRRPLRWQAGVRSRL